jgi:hypothetical protein
LIASLEGWTVPKVVYATRDDFVDGAPTNEILTTLREAVDQAGRVARASAP